MSLVLLLAPVVALAAPPRAVLEVWDRGDWAETERLARRSIEDGALAPHEVVDCYVYLGTARALQGKKAPAVAAFRAAYALNDKLELPSRDNKVNDAAKQAREDIAQIGAIQLDAQIPKQAKAGGAVTVRTTIDEAHVDLAKRLELFAQDAFSGREHHDEVEPAEHNEFRLPAELIVPGAHVRVRLHILDRFRNRLASVEGNVTVDGERVVHSTIAGGASQIADKPAKKRGPGLWATPWPYIVGGAVLLAASGASAYYFWLRPPDVVSVGAPRVLSE